MWLVPVVSLILVSGCIHWSVYLRRSVIFFAVRVPPEFHQSPEGRAVARTFLLQLWAATAIAGAVTVLAVRSGYMGWASFTPLLVLAAASAAYYRAFQAVLPHALPVPAVRTAALFAPVEEGLPGGWALLAGPFIVLLCTSLYVRAHWAEIPERFPIHWGIDGKPNGWSARTVLGVFGPLLLAFAIQATLVGIAAFTLYSSRRTRMMAATMKVLVATAWFIALLFSIVTLTPLMPGPPPIWAILAGVAAFVAYVIWLTAKAASEPSDEPPTSEEFWKWGQVYYNPDDPALFVEKRVGIGYTLNFAHRAAWVFVGGVVGLPLLGVLVALWK
jgi:uncharacterized membrane protein